MKTQKKIFIAFILNLIFSIFEFVGGIITGSVAISSDAVHDMGDAISIGMSYFLERKSKKQPNQKYTYGYLRFSVLGSVITTTILFVGSLIVIYNAILRIINPIEINYNGMIIFAIFGAVVNFVAAYFTSGGKSLNQKAVNLHMLEDVLGWIIVLIGAVVMRFTDIMLIDSIMSIGVAIFILINTIINLKEALDIFLVKIPKGIEIEEIKNHILEIDGVEDVHHIHIWTMDGTNNYATLHVVSKTNLQQELKKQIKEELIEHQISHSTIEFEAPCEECLEKTCHTEFKESTHHHHHHH